ncbi:MAG: proline dehydrogenase family protein, partial [Saprospiraceae bacterium]|nr:proline dehydrogenase family protein [Saprospiraceae bacterium]
SCQLMAEIIDGMKVSKNHAHLNFCQLYGMSDNLTFNLAAAGYNAAKYLPYGPVREVIPYLVRRAQENSSITGDISREYGMILTEVKRRGL